MTSIDIILDQVKDEKIRQIAKLAYRLGVQDTKNSMLVTTKNEQKTNERLSL